MAKKKTSASAKAKVKSKKPVSKKAALKTAERKTSTPKSSAKKAGKKTPNRILTGAVVIDSPESTAGFSYVMPNNTVCVAGVAAEGTESVWILVLEGSETPDLGVHTKVVVDVSTSLEFAVMVPYGGVIPAPLEFGNYQVVAFPVIGGTPGSPTTVNFRRWPESEEKSVSATSCLWYALADDTAEGPYQEEIPVQNYQPLAVKIPTNAGKVSISASGRWRHFANDPATEADPDGIAAVVVGLENSAYQNAAYGSDAINVLETNVCKFLGLWNDGGTHTLFEIGTMLTDQTIPDEARVEGFFYLGMHDGKRWFNNSGAVTASITWIPEECAARVRARRLAKSKGSKAAPAKKKSPKAKKAAGKKAKRK